MQREGRLDAGGTEIAIKLTRGTTGFRLVWVIFLARVASNVPGVKFKQGPAFASLRVKPCATEKQPSVSLA